MSLQQFLIIAWARRKLALWTLLVTVVLVTLVSLVMPKQYEATSSLVFDFRADPIAGAVAPAMASPAYLATQIDVMQSDRVAGRAARLLGLDKNADAIESWREATEGKQPIDIYYGSMLSRHLTVKPGRGSNVVSLTYTSSDPQFAAAAANAFAQAFIDVNVELRVEPARQYSGWFDQRMKTLRVELERAQSRLSSFQKEKGIVASEERVDNETARLNALEGQMAEIQGQRAVALSRQKHSGNELSPDVMESPIIQSIKTDIAKAEARLSELSSNLGNNHPVYRQAEAQIFGLRQQLREEMRRISGSAGTASKIAAQQEDELRAAIEAQKKRVLDLRAERDAIAVLARDVDSAQRAYDAVAQRTTMSNLESQIQQNNVGMLSPAIEPDEPAKPRLALNIIAAVFFGLMLAAGLALGLEKLDRRVRLPGDLATLPNVPLLGVLQPRLRRPTAGELLARIENRLQRRNRRRRLANNGSNDTPLLKGG